jgi:TMEM175 potassium channel family protein
MTSSRLETFSDGVIAILITIMVLELGVPHGVTFDALRDQLPVFLSYVLSFVNLGIYWMNHHHLLSTLDHATGAVLGANLTLLFWLSLFPFTTAWMGENSFAWLPVAGYGVVALLASISFGVLARVIIRTEGPDSRLARAVGKETKGKVSTALYALGVGLAYPARWVSLAIYLLVILMWFIPDRRIEAVHQDSAAA